MSAKKGVSFHNSRVLSKIYSILMKLSKFKLGLGNLKCSFSYTLSGFLVQIFFVAKSCISLTKSVT